MIYKILKQLIRVLLAIYFRRTVVIGKENIPGSGPLIIVANHPNTMIDPLIVSSIVAQRVGFLGNAGIFSNKLVARILRYFHVIPIYRKKDVLPGEKQDNTASFAKCHEYLQEGNTLLIFPEGSSYYELKLREIKTGTARIALSYEADRNFAGALTILPIALDYSDSIQFRSDIAVTVGKPIRVGNFREQYEADEMECVRILTKAIRDELANYVPHTDGKEQEQFLLQAHQFYTTFENPLEDERKHLQLRAQLSKAMPLVHKEYPETYHLIQEKTTLFFNLLATHQLTPGFVSDAFLRRNPVVLLAGYIVQFIALLPVYLLGLLTNYIPYLLPAKIFKLLRLEIEYKSTIQMFVGMLTFPLYYILVLKLGQQILPDVPWWTAFPLFGISGFVVLYYWAELKRFRRLLRYHFSLTQSQKQKLVELRDDIRRLIEDARTKLNHLNPAKVN